MFQLVACHLNVDSPSQIYVLNKMFQLVACHLNVAFSFTNICSEQDVSIGSLPS